jgi:hypothetical protein
MALKRLPRTHLYLRFCPMIAMIFVTCAFVCLAACGPKKSGTDTTNSDGPVQKPATVEQATQVLDLSTFP